MKIINVNILKVMELSQQLLFCADKGDMQREDDGCGVLFGIVRDCAYKLHDAAQKEKLNHLNRGIWDEEDEWEVF